MKQYFCIVWEGLVLLLWAEGRGPVTRTFSEETLSEPSALFSRCNPTYT